MNSLLVVIFDDLIRQILLGFQGAVVLGENFYHCSFALGRHDEVTVQTDECLLVHSILG